MTLRLLLSLAILTSFAVAAAPLRTRQEADALIQKAGETKPQWLDATPLEYPKTLDLSRTQIIKGWDTQRNLGVYIMGAVNPDPSKWKSAAKLLHHVLEAYKDDPNNVQKTRAELAHVYGDLLGDYARGAYWMGKVADRGDMQEAALARYYRLLGDPTMTREIASKYELDDTRSASVVRMWSSIGDLDKALKTAEEKAEFGDEDVAYLAAGDACRREGKFDDAAKYYGKAIAAEDGTRDIQRNKARAKAGLDAVKAAASIDLAKLPDGTYSASSPGFRGDVTVEVVVKAHRIESARVARHRDDWPCNAPTDIPAQIVERQGIAGVDAVTGATITSEAIVNAAAKALAGAAR